MKNKEQLTDSDIIEFIIKYKCNGHEYGLRSNIKLPIKAVSLDAYTETLALRMVSALIKEFKTKYKLPLNKDLSTIYKKSKNK